jgi:hypothetical protein
LDFKDLRMMYASGFFPLVNAVQRGSFGQDAGAAADVDVDVDSDDGDGDGQRAGQLDDDEEGGEGRRRNGDNSETLTPV